ncbi:hypothetical protein [Intestinimonas sp. HCP28S3_D6]|uniref:hypothetical protein n=1 Tax=Intestinimonas sp. HCP28S3_D6 TaxID=3438942 RepID=UPI003F8CE7BD
MEQNFVFQVTAPDVDALLPEVSSALEQWMELFSRRKYPKLWALTDRINRWNKAPTARTKRRRQGQVQGLVNWIVAMVMLPAAFLTPDSPLLTIIGGVCLGIGVVDLWRYLPKTLGVLSLLAGVFFLMAVLGDPDEMAILIYLAAQYLIVALASLLVRKRQDPYDRAARKLLRKRNTVKGLELVRVIFSEEKFSLGWKDASKIKSAEEVAYPYRDFKQVIETDSVLLIVCCKKVLFLQKNDLLEGTLPELRSFLRERVLYVEGAAEQRKESIS